MKKTKTLGFKLVALFMIFLLLVLGVCGVVTYLNQMSVYRRQCETDARSVGEYLEKLIAADGADFARYQAYYLEHYAEADIPVDVDDYVPYREAFERLLHEEAPGRTLGVDIELEELSDAARRAYLTFRHVYWVLTFEQARDACDLTYAYYIVPDSSRDTVTYMIDGVRTSRAEHIEFIAEYPDYGQYDHPQGDEAEYLYLAEEVENDREQFSVEWTAWESEGRQTGFQVWHNEFGNTYAFYTPLVVGGEKLGLIGTEVDIERIDSAILRNTLRQFLVIGAILTAGLLLLVAFIERRYIRKIAELERDVRTFSRTKDASVADDIRRSVRGRDEIASLSEGVAHMIGEIRDHIDSLVEMHHELDLAKSDAARMSELALKDGLTSIRNRTAYDQAVDRLTERLAGEDVDFAIAMIDLNDLKRINDTYGHERGNEAIIRLSRMVCDTFKHSMVFRIGGDEFAAILLNDDYRDREALVARLKADLDGLKTAPGLKPWERIGAAIGLATFDRQKDARPNDVFRRADIRMYEEKKRMKR
ncbi:MAG: diguanylate cyclase [Clostridia bacterium]|nr:diguanylate cyclase [Clostridia bacterium]